MYMKNHNISGTFARSRVTMIIVLPNSGQNRRSKRDHDHDHFWSSCKFSAMAITRELPYEKIGKHK